MTFDVDRCQPKGTPYPFADWKAGKPCPLSWDAADAVDDGWTKAELDAFMKATVEPWPRSKVTTPAEQPEERPVPPAGPPVAQSLPQPVREARTTQQEQFEPAANIVQITGIDRFDLELEAWLTARRWAVKLNLLSGVQELHRPSGVTHMSDERVSEIRFSFKHASNGKEPAKDKVFDGLGLIAERRAYHPVRDYLAGVRWDGVARLNGWLARYAGADDTALNAAFARKVLCAAVRRVRDPGCKFDHIVALQGAQGAGKSTLIRSLCDDPAWFTDQVTVGADAKETIEKTSGKWIIEMPELDGMNRRDAGRVKSFVTTTHDKSRLAYARFAVERPRQFVLFGTTNDKEFLSDLTGNRRWWIVGTGTIDSAGLAEVRDMLWAEAVQAEPAENLWLDDPELSAAAAAIAGQAVDYGAWFNLLADKIPDGPMMISCNDAWELVGIAPDAIHKVSVAHGHSLRKALAGLGFDPEPKNRRRFGRQASCYIRGGSTADWWAPGNPPPQDDDAKLSDW
jgi:hypothetical protein